MGSTTLGKILINTGFVTKCIQPEEFSYFESLGWNRGRITKDGIPSKIPCKYCGKLISKWDGKSGVCHRCFVDLGYQKALNRDPEICRKRVESQTGKSRSDEFKRKQSENMKNYYRNHPERRKFQGEIFSQAWKDGKHDPNYSANKFNRSKPELMMYQAFVNLFGENYVSRDHVQGSDKRWCYPDILLFDRIVIEYFGDYYHGNPKYYGPNDVVSYECIAKDVWEHDKDRIDRILKSVPRGYIPPEDCCPVSEVIVIWESDVSNLKTQEDWDKYVHDRFCGYDEELSI